MEIKTRKAFLATIWTILLALACYTTVSAVNQYLWEQNQRGEQDVTYAIEGNYANFTLPHGYVDVPSYSIASPSPVLDLTTYKANLVLQISCLNHLDLQGNYSDLRLEVIWITHGSLSPLLDLRSSNIFNFTLTSIGNYLFDYRIYYTPTTPATNTLLLHIDIIDSV